MMKKYKKKIKNIKKMIIKINKIIFNKIIIKILYLKYRNKLKKLKKNKLMILKFSTSMKIIIVKISSKIFLKIYQIVLLDIIFLK